MNDSREVCTHVCKHAAAENRIISDEMAKSICFLWHGGPKSPFYAFATKGKYNHKALMDELFHIHRSACLPDDLIVLDCLFAYIEAHP